MGLHKKPLRYTLSQIDLHGSNSSQQPKISARQIHPRHLMGLYLPGNFTATRPPPKAASRQVSQPIFNTIKMSPSLSSHQDCQHFRPDTDVYGLAMFAEPANGRSTTSQHVMFAFLSTWFTRPAHFARVTAATSSANDRKRVVYNGTMRARSLPPLSGIALVNRRLPSPLNITSRGKLLL